MSLVPNKDHDDQELAIVRQATGNAIDAFFDLFDEGQTEVRVTMNCDAFGRLPLSMYDRCLEAIKNRARQSGYKLCRLEQEREGTAWVFLNLDKQPTKAKLQSGKTLPARPSGRLPLQQ